MPQLPQLTSTGVPRKATSGGVPCSPLQSSAPGVGSRSSEGSCWQRPPRRPSYRALLAEQPCPAASLCRHLLWPRTHLPAHPIPARGRRPRAGRLRLVLLGGAAPRPDPDARPPGPGAAWRPSRGWKPPCRPPSSAAAPEPGLRPSAAPSRPVQSPRAAARRCSPPWPSPAPRPIQTAVQLSPCSAAPLLWGPGTCGCCGVARGDI
mmetsp:Transcript_65106/g.146855  ORF Transcript_65106/g.146855 Transcript_65106/m.146855 type:complete len:206 (-) Transcript_65106:41-658(-)